MYGPVRTVVWQGSAGDRRPYADQPRLCGAQHNRGYIQYWLKTEKEIANHSAARIFAAATSILKAGTSAAGSL